MNAANAEHIEGAQPDIPALFERLQANRRALRQTTASQRAEKIRRLLKAVLDARQEIREVVRGELGLCDTDIDAQLIMIKAEAEFIIKHLPQWMQPQPVKGSLMTLGKKCYVQYEPKGVVLHLATWNAPYAIGLVPAMGAIAAGNAFCLKPSELAPASSALLKRLVESVFSTDEFAVVEGGAEVAQALLAQPFDHIFYVGGHHVGKIVAKAAAEHFASFTLEMGGKNPVIVDASADLEDAARKISWGRISNAGQICIAPDYALVHESVAEEFIQQLQAAMTAQYNADGAGFDKSEYYPRVVNNRHFERVKALIDDARDNGANIRFGGETDAADRYIAPTIIDNVNEDMRIMQDEIFGPVITVTPFADNQQVLDIIERRAKPLSLYVFSKDEAQTRFFMHNTTAGNSVVNHNVIQSGTNPHLPFGGVNHSGSGRIGGWSTFEAASNARSVIEEGPAIMDPNLMFPPYDEKYQKMVDDMLRKTVKVPDAVIKAINGVIRLRSFFSGK